MKTNTPRIWLASILALSLLAGCSHHTSLTGAWSATDGETVEFLNDGTFTLKNIPSGNGGHQFIAKLSGPYTMVDPAHLKLEITTPSGKISSIYQFSISDRELILQESGKEAKRFQQVKN